MNKKVNLVAGLLIAALVLGGFVLTVPSITASVDNKVGTQTIKKSDITMPSTATRVRPDLIVCKCGPGLLTNENFNPSYPNLAIFNFTAKVHNVGESKSKECWLKIKFAHGNSESRKIPALKPGETNVQSILINAQLDATQSDTYTVWIDQKNEVDESNENNNTLNGKISVKYLEGAVCSGASAQVQGC